MRLIALCCVVVLCAVCAVLSLPTDNRLHALPKIRDNKIQPHTTEKKKFQLTPRSGKKMDSNSVDLSFPEVNFSHMEPAKFKSRATGQYLAVRNPPGQAPTLTTKDSEGDQDPEVLFLLHTYRTAEENETLLVLPLHKPSASFLRMTLDRTLVLQRQSGGEDTNSVDDGALNPRAITKADGRFFYLKDSGPGESYKVLEAMNGRDYNHLLSVPGKDMAPQLLNTTGPAAPLPAIFEIIYPRKAGEDRR